MNEFYQNFNSVSEFNYSVHISEEFHFVYFNNPKCACTTIKASLNLACAAALGLHLKYQGIGDIHNRHYNLLKTPGALGYARFRELLADPSYFKFCFIREPVHRIVSAFASKLTWRSDSLAALNRRLGRPDSAALPFCEFIEVLASDDSIRDMDEHWRLQAKQVCFDLVQFDKIGLFEEFDSHLKAVLQRLFGEGQQIFDARQHFQGNISNSNSLIQTLTEHNRAEITEIYKDDLALYSHCTERQGLD